MLPTIETTCSFFCVALLLCFMPGPDNLFVLVQSAAQGRKAGLMVVLGLCTGLIGHTAAVACGLAAVFAASPTAFLVLQFAGAAYLVCLAWQAFRAPTAVAENAPKTGRLPAFRLYLRGVVMNLTNPKVLLFFLAFLPQFVEPKRGHVPLQIVWFGVVFVVATLLSFGLIAQLAGYLGEKLDESPRTQRIMNGVTALVFVGLALRLVFLRR